MNVTMGSITEESGQIAPPKPPRSSLNYNSPYPQILETQHSSWRGRVQSMGGYGTEGAGDGEGDGQFMPQKVLILDTGEESRGKDAGPREEGEHVEKEKVIEDDLVTEDGEGQEETGRRGDGGERNGQERLKRMKKSREEGRGRRGRIKEKRHRRERKARAQLLPNNHSIAMTPHHLSPQNHPIWHGNQMDVEQGSIVKTMETQSSGQVDREGGTPGLSGLRRPTSRVSDSTDTPDRNSLGLSAVSIATTSSGAPSGPGETSSGAPSGPVDTSSGAPSGPGDTSSGAPSGPGDTSSGAPSGPGDTSSGAPSGPGDTSSGAPSGPADTSSDTMCNREQLRYCLL
ncbi:protein SPT2 homolog [Oncorhynchus mykiss]|uniref:protein SPT2 homolog n=1 Tax=Oncorhynchus mykiss TaxID=8022 RepID=UPI0018777924|nr:protein SPT2 homolog [Oncorhynchus mykiss]